MQKIIIKNRKDQNVVVILDQTTHQKDLVFVMHGLGGNKHELQIEAFAQAFVEASFSVVRFDTTNTFGESDGAYENATVTNYFEDLEDVIAWANTQSWYQEPFYLTGTSLGGICTILYTQKYPNKVKALAPLSTVISGELRAQVHGEAYMTAWKQKGYRDEPSVSVKGRIKRLNWNHMVDNLKYDVLKSIKKLTMPVLLIVGENDTITPPSHHELLFDKLPGSKELHIIKNGEHTFRDPQQLKQIQKIIKNWVAKTEK